MPAPPMIPGCPPGLEYLSQIDQLLIHQGVNLVEVITCCVANSMFEIKNSMGQKVYSATEENDCCNRNCCGGDRCFIMTIADNTGCEVMKLIRPCRCSLCCCPCCLQKLEVQAPPGVTIGYVKQEWHICLPKFTMQNEREENLLKICGPCVPCRCCTDINFELMTLDETSTIGHVSKQWTGIVKEALTDADNFCVRFPMDLDVKVKAVVIAACFLIDFMFFENSLKNISQLSVDSIEATWLQELRASQKCLTSSCSKQEQALQASYHVAHRIAEDLILPAAIDMAREVLDQSSADKLKTIPLSNDTIRRTIQEMEALAAKDMVPMLHKTLKDAVKVVNYIKRSAKYGRCFQKLCIDLGSEHRGRSLRTTQHICWHPVARLPLSHTIRSLSGSNMAIQAAWTPTQPTSCPPGLECLIQADRLLIHQQHEFLEAITGFETNNSYEIKNNLGQNIYFAGEQSDCCSRYFCGSLRSFIMTIVDNANQEVIRLLRPLRCDCCCTPCCLQKLEVQAPPGIPAGYVIQNWHPYLPKFTIQNERGQNILKISGPCILCRCCSNIDFEVKSLDETYNVGRISKQWSGFGNEMFTDVDNFGVQFPLDLDVKVKAVILGACFLIDFMFFEHTENN
ncbi:uncharacterized protein LOC128484089 [Spea bombifrons]|uniref:uncharacterized protein LOC128484089 n=1 Tax=Spea bombifrons TaxID=233779 RepID=UPI00234BE312|nr:uncharacterized protein LOC128484089 [Spea bombifrons]